MITADMHTHSCASPDGESRMNEIFKAGKDVGTSYICVTDHCEVCQWDGKWGIKNIDLSYKLYCELKEKDGFLFGAEMGGADADFKRAEELVKRYPYDFILGSVHNLVGMKDFYYLDYDEYDADELLTLYFNAAESIIENADFDSLAHLTYPLRYIPKEKYDMRRHEEHIERVLLKLIKSGRALEINTSGLRKPEKITYPDEGILRLYKKLGGRYVTLGSDGHFPKDVCAGIGEAERMLLNVGFDSVAVYINRKRLQINICEGMNVNE